MKMTMLNKDGFFDEALSIQLLTSELEELFNEAGWETTARYRVWSPLLGDDYRKKFGEVKLFSSIGSDGHRRNFGYFVGYGGKVTPIGAEPTISRNSELGELKEIEGSMGAKFQFQVYPVASSSVIIYKEDGTIVDEEDYTIDYENGVVQFIVAPNSKVYATYSLTDNAPDMVKRMWYFTFEDFRPERFVFKSDGLDESKMINKLDGRHDFPLRPGERVKKDSVTLYDQLGEVIPKMHYTINYKEGYITFGENYTEPPVVYSDYIAVIDPDGVDFGDIEVPDFDPQDPESLANAVYSALRYIFPSIPTALSFIPDDEYGLGWGRNSQIYVWGNANRDRIVMYHRVDPAPDPEKTYFTPLYVGRLSTIGKSPIMNTVLIGGAREKDEIKYRPGLKLGRNVVDYGVNTSNGNSSVLLYQSVGGAINQKHYLSFITHDIEIDRTQESRFNPSVYSGKYHISPMYIVHPADGYVGRLDEVYAIHPKNISQLDELEVTEKSVDEHIGTGDGVKDTFHFFHKPVLDEEFAIQLVSEEGCQTLTVESGGFTIYDEGGIKKVKLDEAPENGVEVMATYNYNQVYRYTLADTPITPFVLANVSPYAPIGLGFLKENIE